MNIADLSAYLRDRVALDDTSGCWLWTGSVSRYGYGRTLATANGARPFEAAHRAVWKELVGSLDPAMTLHHECHERRCVNPAHLHPIGRAEHSALHTDETCKWGHSLADAYVYPRPNRNSVYRMCRQCQLDRQARYREQRRSA